MPKTVIRQTTWRAALAYWIALATILPVQLQAQETSKVSSTSSAAAAVAPLPRAKPEEVGMSSQRLAEIGKILNEDIERGQLPGAVVAIARKGKLVYFEAFGYRDKVAGVPMTTDTIFNVASMTKPMTTVAALTLYEQGRIMIDDPIEKYLPKFASMKVATLDASGDNIIATVPAKRKITIQDLMRHTSGIVYGGRGHTAVHKMLPDGSSSLQAMTSDEVIDKLSAVPLLHQPGSTWDYGFGLDLTGLIVERLTQQTLAQVMRERIWTPLGMNDTSFQIPADKLSRYAKALPEDPLTGRPQSVSPDLAKPLKFECGGGCAASTAGDYMRFAMMLLNNGRLGDRRILGRKTAEYMLSNQLGPEVKNLIGDADPTRADYGFGLGLAVRTTAGVVRMTGSVGEFSWPGASGTNWWADPQEQLVVVFMSHAPGPARWHYRQLLAAMVNQAIID
jgi:CubicO group peptidase (beta-lactamase class C family)